MARLFIHQRDKVIVVDADEKVFFLREVGHLHHLSLTNHFFTTTTGEDVDGNEMKLREEDENPIMENVSEDVNL